MTEDVIKKMAKEDVYLVVEALMSNADAPPQFSADQREKFELAKSGFNTEPSKVIPIYKSR